jgi:putative two-component system response regulator
MPQARVLIVDDEAPNVALLERILGRHGYQHLSATTDPTRAVALFVEVRPDIVLLDLRMPKLDGIALMGQIRAVVEPDDYVPIVLLTADTTPEARSRAVSAGANEFLTKPFDISEVVLRVGNLLASRARHVQLQRHRAVLAETRRWLDQKRSSTSP